MKIGDFIVFSYNGTIRHGRIESIRNGVVTLKMVYEGGYKSFTINKMENCRAMV